MRLRRTKAVLWLVGIVLVLALGIYLGSNYSWRHIENRVYRIGWQQDPPFQQKAEDGSPIGLTIDLVRDAARRRGIRLMWVWHPGSSEAALRNREVDLWPLITVTPERKHVIHISRPFLQHDNSLLVRAGSRYSGVQDLASAKISYLDLPINQQLLHGALPNARLIAGSSVKDVMEDVCTLRADAAFLDEFTASAVLLGGLPCSPQALRVIPMPMLRTTLGVGSTLEASSVADEIRRGIDDAAHEDLARILMRWGYSSQQNLDYFSALMDAERRERWLIVTLGVVASLLAVTVFGTDHIRRQRNRIKMTEGTLRNSEQKLLLLANNLNEMVLAYDMDRRLIFANPAVERLTGYSVTELQRENSICWVHADDRSRMLGYWDKLFEGGGAYRDEEYRLVTKYGQIKWAAATWGPIFDDGGRQIGVQGSEREITERKLAEERFRQLAENLDQVFWMFDIGTNKALYVSPAFEKVWGCSPGALYQDRDWLLETVHPEDKDRFAAFFAKTGSGSLVECYRILRPDGTVRWIHDRAFAVRNPEGKAYRVAGIAEDITAQRELEEQLIQTNKMEAVGRLAGGVAHDFNNLLTVICGYSQVLLETADTGDPRRGKLEQILNAANRAGLLTKQLLAFSRRQVLQPRLVNVNHLVTNMETMLGRMIGEHITIETALDPELGLIKGDPHQLEQVVMNLAVNARDAMPNGGVFRIETSMADAGRSIAGGSAGGPGKRVRLTIGDTGCGMDERIRERVFEPFFTTKGVGKGTGLGLSTVYGIVHQNQGTIQVSSQPGQGTIFELYFPIAEGEPDEAAPSKPGRKPEATETILLAEDEPGVRGLVRETLRQLGYTVLEAADGYGALELIEEHKNEIHLLLTDVIMPLMNGHELAMRLQAIRPGTKVLYMSGYTDDVLAFHGIVPEIDFIQKPFSPADLAAKLEKVLSAGKSEGE